MRSTGFVRRVDDLGRLVIPKELLKSLGIKEGDPMEILTSGDGEIIFKPYQPTRAIDNLIKEFKEMNIIDKKEIVKMLTEEIN